MLAGLSPNHDRDGWPAPLARIAREARDGWPAFDVPEAIFCERLVASSSADVTAAALESLHSIDLYLATGCALGIAEAMASFEMHCFGDSSLASQVDRSGTTHAGTPAYASPEQLEGKEANERSDQFSFCAALFEALFGALPFEGKSAEERRREANTGLRFPRPHRVSRAIRRVLSRGLRAEGAERYPSMDALLQALGRRPRPCRAAWLAGGMILGSVVVAGVLTQQARATRIEACAASESRFDGVWDEAKEAAVAHAFAQTDRPYAQAALASVRRAFDDYAGRWKMESRASCEATRLRREQSEETFALRTACFERQLEEVKALTDRRTPRSWSTRWRPSRA